MLLYAPSRPSILPSAAPFEGCEQLFTHYPMAAMPHSPADGLRSMVLVTRFCNEASFFTLSETDQALFHIRAWNSQEEAIQEVIPGRSVPGIFAHAIAEGMPIPRDRAVLGWVADHQVTAILAVHSQPAANAGTASSVPEIQVMPMSGTTAPDWPPFTTRPLNDGRLWDYVDRGDIVDLVSLLTDRPGQVFRADCSLAHGHVGHGTCVVVTENLISSEYWLPSGVYADHWMLREGITAPSAGQLLRLPAVMDLARELGAQKPAVVASELQLRRRR